MFAGGYGEGFKEFAKYRRRGDRRGMTNQRYFGFNIKLVSRCISDVRNLDVIAHKNGIKAVGAHASERSTAHRSQITHEFGLPPI